MLGRLAGAGRDPVVMVLLLPAGRLPAGKREDQPETLTVPSCTL